MAPPRPSSSHTSTAYALSLLSEYTHTLDSLPLDLSRNFADLRELDAVLSSSMASITTRIHKLTKMIQEGTVPKEERLWLLTEIAEEAARLKLGGEDKIRVACQAADNLKSHTNHLRTLLEHLPAVDPSTLIRQSTTYPHVASRSFAPTGSLDSSRRRRGGGGGFMTGNSEASPAKRRRGIRDDDVDGARSPRKDRAPENSHSQRQRNGARTKKQDRAGSPAESILSVTSHMPAQYPQNNSAAGPSSRPAASSNTSNRTGGNKRARPLVGSNLAPPAIQERTNSSTQDTISYTAPAAATANTNTTSSSNQNSRSVYNAPPSSSSSHPSLPLPYGGAAPNGIHVYDLSHPASSLNAPDWTGHPVHGQLEGPGMPVARGQSHTPLSLGAGAGTIPPIMHALTVGSAMGTGENAPVDGAEGEGDGDDKTYCICDGVSYGEMIACDDLTCEREWFHLTCIALPVPPEGTWYCESCRIKRAAKRSGRGGRKRTGGGGGGGGGGGRTNARTANA